jgi:hypothetical protein
MLTIDSELRPDAKTLLSDKIFDPFRKGDELIDAVQIEKSRAHNLLDIIPERETNPIMVNNIIDIMHYNFNNIESTRLAVCLCYMLPLNYEPNIIDVIAIAASIFDSDYIEIEPERAMELLKILNYDLLQPVSDSRVIQRLDMLFSTV